MTDASTPLDALGWPPSSPPSAPSSTSVFDLPPPLVDALAVLVAMFGVILAFAGTKFFSAALAVAAGVVAGYASYYALHATVIASGSLSPLAGVGVACACGAVALAIVAACSVLSFILASAFAAATTVAITLCVLAPGAADPVMFGAVAGAAALAAILALVIHVWQEESPSPCACCRLQPERGRLARLVEASASALLGGACVAFATNHFLDAGLSPEQAFHFHADAGTSCGAGKCLPPATAGLAFAAAGFLVQAACVCCRRRSGLTPPSTGESLLPAPGLHFATGESSTFFPAAYVPFEAAGSTRSTSPAAHPASPVSALWAERTAAAVGQQQRPSAGRSRADSRDTPLAARRHGPPLSIRAPV